MVAMRVSLGIPITLTCVPPNRKYQWEQGIGAPGLASLSTPAHTGPGPRRACPPGPLTSAVPVVPGQGEAGWAGAGEAARHVVAGVGAGAGAAGALVPVWGGDSWWSLSQALLAAGWIAHPAQAEGLPHHARVGIGCSPTQNSPWVSSSKPSGQPTSFSSARQKTGPKDTGREGQKAALAIAQARDSLPPAWPG